MGWVKYGRGDCTSPSCSYMYRPVQTKWKLVNGAAILLCAIYHLEISSSILIADGISFTLWHSSPLYINVVGNATGILGIRSCLDVSLRFIIVSRGSYTSFAIRLNGDVAKATVASLHIFYSTSARRGRCDRSLCGATH